MELEASWRLPMRARLETLRLVLRVVPVTERKSLTRMVLALTMSGVRIRSEEIPDPRSWMLDDWVDEAIRAEEVASMGVSGI